MKKPLNQAQAADDKRRMEKAGLKIRRILVPLDFSGLARQALNCAVPLARKYKAKISLVHVVPPALIMAAFPGEGSFLPVNNNNKVFLKSAKLHLDKLAARLLPGKLLGRKMVREGNAAFEVVQAAKVLKADLIVLSTNSRSGLQRAMFGSTAERIVRHADCPVLTVRRQTGTSAKQMLLSEKPAYPAGLPWNRILVPLDFSLSSLRALEAIVPLAQPCGARLFLLNVIEPNPYSTGMDGSILLLPDYTMARDAKSQLPRIAHHFVPASVPVTPLVLRGRASSVIVETAAQNGVDLIVLSTHGHTGLNRLLLGSTAEQVVRHANCPVLVLRKIPKERN